MTPKTFQICGSFDEIDFDSLPLRYVVKKTHDYGSVVIVTECKPMNKVIARKKIERSLKITITGSHANGFIRIFHQGWLLRNILRQTTFPLQISNSIALMECQKCALLFLEENQRQRWILSILCAIDYPSARDMKIQPLSHHNQNAGQRW